MQELLGRGVDIGVSGTGGNIGVSVVNKSGVERVDRNLRRTGD
jgi:hypothetical protein